MDFITYITYRFRDGEYYYDLYTDAINEIKALCHLVNQVYLNNCFIFLKSTSLFSFNLLCGRFTITTLIRKDHVSFKIPLHASRPHPKMWILARLCGFLHTRPFVNDVSFHCRKCCFDMFMITKSVIHCYNQDPKLIFGMKVFLIPAQPIQFWVE